jgi:membrane associated rhomboid family serine protease
MLGMRTYLLTAPRWVVGLFGGLVFGIGIAAIARFTSPPASWLAATVTGVITGALFGAVLAFTLDKQRRDLRAAAGDLPPGQLSEAYRAAAWGPIPGDPTVRAAAVRVAQRRLEAIRRARILFAILAILMTVGTVMNLLAGNYGLAAALAAAALAWGTELDQPRRLRRRLGRLSAEDQTV